MDRLCITDAVKQFGVTSKTLRYYERAGLLEAKRSDNNNYRYYNESEVDRIKQILILRKMQISVKDIIRIYENENMSTVVEVFTNRINTINGEIGALSQLKQITNEFLQIMIQNGVTKISALPILYEQMEKHLDIIQNKKTVNYAELSSLSDKLAKPVEPSILFLAPMRVLSSLRKDGLSDPDDFYRRVQVKNIPQGEPGLHEQFEFQQDETDVVILRIGGDYVNDSEYLDYVFEGGLFAVINVYLDEDLVEQFRSLIEDFDSNKYYQIDYKSDGMLRHPAMLESLISPDNRRELVALLVPVKKRLADPSLFDKPVEITDISVEELETANPVLWSADVELDKLTPVNNPHYRLTEDGEAEYIAWISTRVLSTDIEVKLPFRMDVEFRIHKEKIQFAWGADEGNIRFYHGSDLNYLFGINMETNPDERLSQEAICFHQPVFRDYFRYPKRGSINRNEYNRLTWIVGEKHLAVIINGEIRYCGENFPYMSVDLKKQEILPIIIGSNGQSKIFFKSICISQLVQNQKPKTKGGTLVMTGKQSNNTIPNIHRFIISEHGENYHFNGCARYIMESLGEYAVDSDLMTDEIYSCKKAVTDLGYWFFAGLTGDILAQVYSYKKYMGEAVSTYLFNSEGGSYFEKIFEKCGYASTFVSGRQLAANKEMYLQTLMAYIDKGIPVIAITHNGPPWGIYVGYEEFGKTLLYLSNDKSEPERIPAEKVFGDGMDLHTFDIIQEKDAFHQARGWIFIGEKKKAVDITQIYRNIITEMPILLTTKTKDYCFGAEAFRAWADDIESGKFDDVTPSEFDGWDAHVSSICNMATNGSCVMNFTCRALSLNPDMTFLEDINKLYDRTAHIWNNDNGHDLEAIGGGFNVTLEVLQDIEKRGKIAAKIREAAACLDEIVQILQVNV